MPSRAGATLLGCALLASSVLLAACSSDPDPAVASTGSPSPSASPTPEPPPTTLLSGRRGKDHQVLAVKVDNTVNSHPQAGLVAADVVYMEEVEWGLTRLMGVYSSHYPRSVGPVRSARESDLQILRQYGKVAFAFSGSNPKIVQEIDQAPLYPLSNDQGANGYSRSPDRAAPWNLFGNPKDLLNGAKKATEAKDVGFTFSDEAPPGGRRVHKVTTFWPAARAQFDWSQKEGRWLLTMDGSKAMSTEGPQLGGTTVIIQSVDVHASSLGDAYGGITPTTETVGKGSAWMFRDGKVWNITWSRPKGTDGTTWEYKGKPIAFDPGQVWIELLDKDRRPQIQ
ncbi:MAG: DUF3048 domain-containing protein [Actinomycetes bacterium]